MYACPRHQKQSQKAKDELREKCLQRISQTANPSKINIMRNQEDPRANRKCAKAHILSPQKRNANGPLICELMDNLFVGKEVKIKTTLKDTISHLSDMAKIQSLTLFMTFNWMTIALKCVSVCCSMK